MRQITLIGCPGIKALFTLLEIGLTVLPAFATRVHKIDRIPVGITVTVQPTEFANSIVNNTDPTGLKWPNKDCGPYQANKPRFNQSLYEYFDVVARDKTEFENVARRRKAELISLLQSKQVFQTANQNHSCKLSNIPIDPVKDLLAMTDKDFAARMAAVPAVVNAAAWWDQWNGRTSGINALTSEASWLQSISKGGYVIGKDLRDKQSAGFLELRYTEFEALVKGQVKPSSNQGDENFRNYKIGNDTITLQSISNFTETGSVLYANEYGGTVIQNTTTLSCADDPWACYLRYLYAHETGNPGWGEVYTSYTSSALAEIAGARLLSDYLQFFEVWGDSSFTPVDQMDRWKMSDPTVYAVACTAAGYACSTQGRGTIGTNSGFAEARASDYDDYIAYMRAIFSWNSSESGSDCMIRPSNVT